MSVFVTVPGTVVAQGPCVNQRSWRAWLSWAPLVVAWAAAPALAQRAAPAAPAATRTNECATPRPGWIWCDDFEQDRLKQYFEYEDADGAFARAAGVGVDGSYGMRVRFTQGQVSAGALHLAVGKVPAEYFRPVDAGSAIYRDLYWRLYVRTQPGWIGGAGYKLSRAISFATPKWAQAMIAHVWGGDDGDSDHLQLDPVRGTDGPGTLRTAGYNDFGHFTWLGRKVGVTPLFDVSHVGRWYCVEAHATLNDPGVANGVFELWVNGNLEARETALNFLGTFSDYGINAVFFENYWNNGAPATQERYFDNIVVSTRRIGCAQ